MVKPSPIGLRNIAAIIVMGVSGSGKSTVGAALAAKIGFSFDEGDNFHSSANIQKMRAGIALTDDDRWPWLSAITEEIDRKIASDDPVVVSCSALKRAYRNKLLCGHENARIVYLRAPRAVLLNRIFNRAPHFMPTSLIDDQLETLEPPMPDERAIGVDACGTVDQTVVSIIKALQA